MLRRSQQFRYRTSRNTGWTQPHLNNVDSVYGPPREQTSDPRMRRKRTEDGYTHLERILTECTFEMKEADNKVFGGDHSTSKAQSMNQLKHFDKRHATPFHPELTMNVLKCATFYTTPTGKAFTNDYLEGRIVGLCLVSETQRCLEFMSRLAVFTQQYTPDFVPVVISNAKEEMEKEVHGYGLNYLTHFRGAALVKRDLGHNTGRWLPMPRLCIVDGTTGFVITHSGYTCVKVKPETCFQSWLEGHSGLSWSDFMLGMF